MAHFLFAIPLVRAFRMESLALPFDYAVGN